MIDNYLVYIVMAITITSVPGPAVFLTVKNSLKYGSGVALMNILGNFVAMTFLALLSVLGLSAVILSSAFLFNCIKIAGGLYLIYLGVKSWCSKVEQVESGPKVPEKGKGVRRSVFREGIGVGLSNPKAIAFFTALFPQFIDPARAVAPQFITLILTIEGISVIILTCYALLAARASGFVGRNGTRALLNKLTGGVFVGFGALLLFEE